MAVEAVSLPPESLPVGARRIHILGGPGTGKSTLATRLGEALEIEVHPLDLIAYEGPEFTERLLEDRLLDVRAIADAPEWVAEGIHLGWTSELLERADLIIWLDHQGWGRSALRLLRRFVALALREVRVQRGARKFSRFDDYRRNFRQLAVVLVASRDYYKPEHAAHRYPVTRETAARELEPHLAKVVRCRSERDVQRLLAQLSSARPGR